MNNHSEKNNVESVPQNHELRNHFRGLKGAAVVLLFIGLFIIFIFSFLKIPPVVEWGFIFFYGLSSLLFLIGRSKALIKQAGEVKDRKRN